MLNGLCGWERICTFACIYQKKLTEMKRILRIGLCVLAPMMALMACSTSYNITGTALQSFYDGDMVYLRPIGGEDTKAVDSCKILHGAFTMTGP